VIIPLVLEVNFTPSSTGESGPPSTVVGIAPLLQIVHGQLPAWPVEITRFTADPETAEVPAPGFSLITSPDGTVGLAAVVTVPTTSPAPAIAELAAACVAPTTLGTDVETTVVENTPSTQ
jgi:hypothetical protein